MKRLLALLAIAVGVATAPAATVNTYVLSVTNTAITSNSITAGGRTRIFTNATTSTTVQTNLAGPKETTTNLFNAFGSYLQTEFSATWLTATQLTLRGPDLVVSVSGGGQPEWATVTTNVGGTTNLVAIVGPPSFPYNTNRTNFGNWIIEYASDYTLGKFIKTNAAAFSNFVSIGISVGGGTQTVYAPKLFWSIQGTNAGVIYGGAIDGPRGTNFTGLHGTVNTLTNGHYVSPALQNPSLTNGVNRGNAFSSPGAGASSEQFGDSATSTGGGALAVGRLADAWGDFATVVGNSSSAGTNAITLGNNSSSSGTGAITIGDTSSTDHSESITIGNNSASTSTNQIRLGNSTHVVSIPGRIDSPMATNLTVTGTNTWKGDIAFERQDITTVAAVTNRVLLGTNAVYRITGTPGADWTLAGIEGGNRNGKMVWVYFNTGFNVTIGHQAGTESIAQNRIISLTGASQTTTGDGAALFWYDSGQSRWIMLWLSP